MRKILSRAHWKPAKKSSLVNYRCCVKGEKSTYLVIESSLQDELLYSSEFQLVRNRLNPFGLNRCWHCLGLFEYIASHNFFVIFLNLQNLKFCLFKGL